MARVVATRKTCSVAECGGKVLAHGVCSTHYTRVRQAIVAGEGSWEDKAFVAKALTGEFARAPGPGARPANGTSEQKKEAPVAPKKPVARRESKPAKAIVHRDVKPANVIVREDEDPELVALEALLAIAELEPEARRKVARVAFSKWGGV